MKSVPSIDFAKIRPKQAALCLAIATVYMAGPFGPGRHRTVFEQAGDGPLLELRSLVPMAHAPRALVCQLLRARIPEILGIALDTSRSDVAFAGWEPIRSFSELATLRMRSDGRCAPQASLPECERLQARVLSVRALGNASSVV